MLAQGLGEMLDNLEHERLVMFQRKQQALDYAVEQQLCNAKRVLPAIRFAAELERSREQQNSVYVRRVVKCSCQFCFHNVFVLTSCLCHQGASSVVQHLAATRACAHKKGNNRQGTAGATRARNGAH